MQTTVKLIFSSLTRKFYELLFNIQVNKGAIYVLSVFSQNFPQIYIINFYFILSSKKINNTFGMKSFYTWYIHLTLTMQVR